ncbi:MAG: carboxylate-amine ligase [Acidimicrobiia bacterium]|nr:carboxylate-amine ligase [Acidimicrobiia bacterium]
MSTNRGFTVGVEEEYLLVDPSTGQLVSDASAQVTVIEAVSSVIETDIGFATPEFLRAQVEVGTGICTSFVQLRDCLRRLRSAVGEAAEAQGLRFIAASTHPMAKAREVTHTDAERYSALAHDLQEVARRMVICGMHVHAGVEDREHRIDLLGQVAYFLPHLLVLSTSSPFWESNDTGMKCYRLSVFDELPRTGLPQRFDSWNEYERHLNVLINAGVIQDSSKIWWDIRPHGRFPTLEMRIADICTYLNDGIAVAALYVCLLGMLQRLRRSNQRWRTYANMLIDENRWRAQRYGADEGLIDFGIGSVVPYADLLEELIEMIMPDAERYDCVDELLHSRSILARGTSSDCQRSVFEAKLAEGATKEEALKAVVDWLADATVADL